ncbi:nitrite reductase (NAD(P)H) small subunit family protein [Salinicola salarius]|uniref:nitrite reductase (NAD(P)H) small subunit family protein n=1 Tax=Salinicola salarius TaxID=430457 RepID=UPI0023E3DBD1|nr:nitrite reductase (NAD(P)H) small subunit family protein [Salinicola salarius]MDF3918613.1 nitrite reductase (NAD(P)H) small subunit family protein [Salinicola salarius]
MSELILENEAARSASSSRPVRLCNRADLVAGSGIVAWHEGHQIALFYLPCRPGAADGLPGRPGAAGESFNRPGAAGESFNRPKAAGELYAVDNRDPFSGANVIGRGIVGDLKGELVVASPIYKQHFRLTDGQCLEDATRRLRTWSVGWDGDDVVLHIPVGADS